MDRDKLTVLTVFVLVAAVALAFRFLDGGAGTDAPGPADGEPIAPSPVGQFRGIALQMHNPGDPNHPYEQFIDEIARTGANAVCLAVHAYQEHGGSSSIFIEARKIPSDERLAKLIAHAHKRRLKVIFMPVVLLENPREGEWRGKIAPKDWSRWWKKYTEYVLHYAQLCQASDVEAFMVGSELLSTESQTKRWRTLIARVRKVYRGLLSYSANWDHYRVPQFWNDLDMVGMTTYYDLTGGERPTLDRLKKAWAPLKKEILNWRATVKKPILFTELGWPNQPTCAQYPWNYYQSEKTDPQAQANCFEAFFATWTDDRNVVGFLVWEWRKCLDRELSPDKDNGYVPYRKPAMKVISRYYQMPDPWGTAAPKPRPATQPATATMPAGKRGSGTGPVSSER